MCAARALSDFVDKVTVVERDAYPSAPEFRSGVPQARHVHNLLARGLREFESFFPGFEARMADRLARAGRVDPPQDQDHPAEASIAEARCRAVGVMIGSLR
jgi:hypothetical protein